MFSYYRVNRKEVHYTGMINEFILVIGLYFISQYLVN